MTDAHLARLIHAERALDDLDDRIASGERVMVWELVAAMQAVTDAAGPIDLTDPPQRVDTASEGSHE